MRISRHVQRCGFLTIAVWPHDDLNILVERYQEMEKPFNGELPEFVAQHFGDVGLANTEQAGGLHLGEPPLFHEGCRS
jgi:hypothetical protein